MVPCAKVFISYSHKDKDLRSELGAHLASLERENLITVWWDHLILPGTEWEPEINQKLNESSIILLLVSSDFIKSNPCYDEELSASLKLHHSGEAVVIPIILRPAAWKKLSFAKLQALPSESLPLTTWDNRDKGWLDVVQGLRKIIDSPEARLAILKSSNPEIYKSINNFNKDKSEYEDFRINNSNKILEIKNGKGPWEENSWKIVQADVVESERKLKTLLLKRSVVVSLEQSNLDPRNYGFPSGEETIEEVKVATEHFIEQMAGPIRNINK